MAAIPTEPTCAKCGYDLAGLPDHGDCPECGKPIRHSLNRGPNPLTQASRQAVWFAVGALITSFFLVVPAPVFLVLAIVRIIQARRHIRNGTLPPSERPFVSMAIVFSVMAAIAMSIMAVMILR